MIERLIAVCAHRPHAVAGLALLGALAGVLCLRAMKVDALPDLSDPQVIVQAEWMGQSPSRVEEQVIYPLSSALLSTPHVKDVRGVSMFGMGFVYVLFEEGTDLYWARSRVLETLQTVRRQLPKNVTPSLGPAATGVGWVYQYALVDHTGKRDLLELRTFQDTTLRYALQSVPGVAEVASVGGYGRQYQVEIHPLRLQALGLSLPEVAGAIRGASDDFGGRALELGGREYYLRGQTALQDEKSLGQVVLRSSPGQKPVLLSDVAQISLGGDLRRGATDLDGLGEVVGGIVVARQDANAQAVIAGVKRRIQELAPALPEGLELRTVYDRSSLIAQTLKTLRNALWEEMLVVAFVLLAFLLHVRSALAAVLILPVALLLSFIPLSAFGVTANVLSLGGMAIALGAMVDAAIVMVENAHKHLERLPSGADHLPALVAAAKEVGPALFFSLLILTVSFLPVFGLTGEAGRLFRPLALTKTLCMAFSALLSVTLGPALMAIFLKGRVRPESAHPISKGLIALYRPFVFVALRRPRTTLAIGLLAVISAVPLIPRLGSEFMPALNEGDLLFMPVTLPGVSLAEAQKALQAQDERLRSFPEVASVFGKVGRADSATDPAPISMAETVVQLRPRQDWPKVRVDRFYRHWPALLKGLFVPFFPEERPKRPEELLAEMNQRVFLPGWTSAFTYPIRSRIDMLETGIRTPLGVKVFGTRAEEVEKSGQALEALLASIPGTKGAFFERSQGGHYLDVVPDLGAMARFGVRLEDVNALLANAVGGESVAFSLQGRKPVSISLRYPLDDRSSVDRISELRVPVSAPSAGTGEMGWNFHQLLNGPYALAQGEPAMAPYSDSLLDALTQEVHGDLPEGTQAVPRAGPSSAATRAFIPLRQLAKVQLSPGPSMLRDEAGLLVGYLLLDVDSIRWDLGGYVEEAKKRVDQALRSGAFFLPRGGHLQWSGQYEQLLETRSRMGLLIPLTLLLVLLLLAAHFRNFAESLVVLCSVPFSLVGSIWLMWLLGHRLSAASCVGLIATVGLAAQTGVVMVVYLDAALERRLLEGKVRNVQDIIWAHLEGTVQRVRPKVMTVTSMGVGLLPLLWAQGTGAEVMKRVAAPMVGGLVSSAFLTLEVLPVVYTYWRKWQLAKGRLPSPRKARSAAQPA